MNITPINHITELKDRFLAQYEDKPNLTQFIEILFGGYQHIENLLLDIISKRYLVNATGQILTDLASNFNLDRVDYSDDTLRALIYVEIVKNISEGTTTDVKNVLRYLGMTDCFITLLPFAGLEVQVKGDMILDVSTVKNILEVCTPPIAIEYTQYSINDPFTFAYDSDGLGLSFGELGHG